MSKHISKSLVAVLLAALAVSPFVSQPHVARADSPPNLTSNIEWVNAFNASTVVDTQAAFNNGRRQEEIQLDLAPNALGNLVMPPQGVWDAKSPDEKALFLLNAERAARGGQVPGVLGLGFQDWQPDVKRIAESWATYLLTENRFGHVFSDTTSPFDRIADDPVLGPCSDYLSRAENIAGFWNLGGTSNPLPVERAIYNWIYDDASSGWGHREAALLQDKDLYWVDAIEGFKNDVDGAGSEGFIGVAVIDSTVWDPFGFSGVTMGTIVVLNIIDPINNGGTCPWELAPTPTPTDTPMPPTSTPTFTPVPPTATPTFTPVPPTATTTPTPTATATVLPPTCEIGSITRYYWLKIGGSKVTDLTKNPRFPNSPNGYDSQTSFEGPTNWGTKYGGRYVGFLAPSLTGYYTFWIASDDLSDLYLSSNSNPSNATRIAYVNDRTKVNEWDKRPNQKSIPIYLVAGQIYYVEALHKQDGGSANLSVAWQPPGGSRTVIDGQYLCPMPDTVSIVFEAKEIGPLSSPPIP